MSDEKASEEKTEDKTEEKVDEKWSQEKQRADQEHANFVKASGERDAMQTALTESADKIAALDQKLADLAEAQDVPIEDLLDPDLTDAKTIKAVSKLAKEVVI